MYVLKHLILAALRIVTGNGKSPAYIGIWLEILNTLYSVCHAAAAMRGENIDCLKYIVFKDVSSNLSQ